MERPIEVITLAMRSIATLASNPALGGGGLKNVQISELVNELATLVEGGHYTYQELRAFALELRDMAERGAMPTRAQWDEFRARDSAARDVIREAKERLASAELEELTGEVSSEEVSTQSPSSEEGQGSGGSPKTDGQQEA